MSVRSRRVTSVATVVGSLDLYTVPAGRTLIVKAWYYYNTLGVAGSIDFGVKPGGGAGILIARLTSSATVGGSASLGNQPIGNPGDIFYVVTSTAMNVHM